jgi:hypothetical protein
VIRYSAPLKNIGEESSLLCLNLVWPTLGGYTPLKERPSIRQYVLEQLSAHNKRIGPKEITKLENTEKFLQLLERRFPYLFYRDP